MCIYTAAVTSAAIIHSPVTKMKETVSPTAQNTNGLLMVTPVKGGTVSATIQINHEVLTPGVSLHCFVSILNLTDFHGIMKPSWSIFFLVIKIETNVGNTSRFMCIQICIGADVCVKVIYRYSICRLFTCFPLQQLVRL